MPIDRFHLNNEDSKTRDSNGEFGVLSRVHHWIPFGALFKLEVRPLSFKSLLGRNKSLAQHRIASHRLSRVVIAVDYVLAVPASHRIALFRRFGYLFFSLKQSCFLTLT